MSVDIRFARFQSSSNPFLQVKSDDQMQVERENFKRMQVENNESDFIGGIFGMFLFSFIFPKISKKFFGLSRILNILTLSNNLML